MQMPKSFYEAGVRELNQEWGQQIGVGTDAVWVSGHGQVCAWREGGQTPARLTLWTFLFSLFLSFKCLETILTDKGQVASCVDV